MEERILISLELLMLKTPALRAYFAAVLKVTAPMRSEV